MFPHFFWMVTIWSPRNSIRSQGLDLLLRVILGILRIVRDLRGPRRWCPPRLAAERLGGIWWNVSQLGFSSWILRKKEHVEKITPNFFHKQFMWKIGEFQEWRLKDDWELKTTAFSGFVASMPQRESAPKRQPFGGLRYQTSWHFGWKEEAVILQCGPSKIDKLLNNSNNCSLLYL